MTTSAKVLQILQLFAEGRRKLQVSDVVDLLGVSLATAYRYLADLEDVGMIERTNPNQYVLGATVVELDRQIRMHDPLIAVSAEIMNSLSARTGGTVILCRRHGLKVMCVHQTLGNLSPLNVSYERGRAMPMYRGATSKVILAHLDKESLSYIVQNDAPAIASAGLPTSLEALNLYLETIRVEKYCHAVGEVDSGVMGWAAAIHHGRVLLGSLSVVMDSQHSIPGARVIVDLLQRAALRIEGRLDDSIRRPSTV